MILAARAADLPDMIRPRGNPNWGRPMLPASVLVTEGVRSKKRLWRERGRQRLEAFALAPWATGDGAICWSYSID